MRAVLWRLTLSAVVLSSVLTVGVTTPGTVTAADVATFQGQSPARAMDTRPGGPTADGQQSGRGPIGSGATLDLPLAGRAGVPSSGVAAVALNVTVTEPTRPGYLTIFPSGTSRPVASNLNFVPGQTTANMVIATPGANGSVSIYNFAGSSHVVVDVLGWFPVGSSFTSVAPARVFETRPALPTVDGRQAGGGKLRGGSTTPLDIAGRAGVPPSGAGSVVVNVTVATPSRAGYVTVFPGGARRPLASTVNFAAGQTVANTAIVPLGADGRILLYNFAGDIDAVVDVLGWFGSGGDFTGLTPARLLDTRSKNATVDGLTSGGGSIGSTSALRVKVTGRGGVPASGVGAVVVNVTATEATDPSFVTAYPAGVRRPGASNLNTVSGRTVANMAIVPVGDHGQITLFNYAGLVDLVVDVLGWFPNPTSPPPSYGNDATLRSTGIGTLSFGATAGDVIITLTPLLGAPFEDEGTFELFPDASGHFTDGTELHSDFRFNRWVCFSPEGDPVGGLCTVFGGADPNAVTFVGWNVLGEQTLSDANGITPGALGGDFADAIVVDAGGCYASGIAHTREGVTLGVSADPPFFSYDEAGNIIVHHPTPDEVIVGSMSAGRNPWFDVDC